MHLKRYHDIQVSPSRGVADPQTAGHEPAPELPLDHADPAFGETTVGTAATMNTRRWGWPPTKKLMVVSLRAAPLHPASAAGGRPVARPPIPRVDPAWPRT